MLAIKKEMNKECKKVMKNNTKTSKYKKMMVTLAATAALAPLAVLPSSFHQEIASAYAAEQAAPATSNLIVHKVQYTGEKPQITNDGSEQTLPSGVENFDPSKYGDVKFTLVDVTTYAKTKSVDDIQAEVNGLTQAQYNNWISTNGTSVGEKSVGADGSVNFNDLAAANSDGSGHVYVILETKSAKGLVNQIAQPMVISLPMTNKAGDGFLNDVNIYPKNEVQDLELTLVKYSEAIKSGNQLQGAEFDLYQGQPGSGTKINKTPLTSDTSGKVLVTGLTKGDYYLVETKAPGNHVISGSAKNNADNKLTFSITDDGVDKDSLHIDFVNYVKPDSEKKVTNGTNPTNEENKDNGKNSFGVGDAVDYTNTIKVPTDIAGGEIKNGENDVTTNWYTVFNYKDIAGTGLTYSGKDTSVTVKGSDGTVLELGKDYTYKAETNGFVIDFIINNGKVSDKVAALAGKEITVSYQMTINEDAKVDTALENSFDLSWNNNPTPGTDSEHITGKIPVYTGGAKFEKVDAQNSAEKLAGAKFVLINSEGKYFAGWGDVNSDGIKEAKWSDTQPTSGDGVLVSDSDGKFDIAGLEYGNYKLKEIAAPDGYAILTTTKDFTISDQTYVGSLNTIDNTKKSELPITGSTQLMIAIVGGILMVTVAGVYYKKRVQH